jgi:hypothetical protein
MGLEYSTTPVIVMAPTLRIATDELAQYGISTVPANVYVVTTVAEAEALALAANTPWCCLGAWTSTLRTLFDYMTTRFGQPVDPAVAFDVTNNSVAWNPKTMRP